MSDAEHDSPTDAVGAPASVPPAARSLARIAAVLHAVLWAGAVALILYGVWQLALAVVVSAWLGVVPGLATIAIAVTLIVVFLRGDRAGA